MHKIRSKKLTILLTLIFVLSIMLPLAGPAAASTSYSALTKPTVSAGTTGAGLGTLYIKIDPMPANAAASAVISLPTDFDVTVGNITYGGLAHAPVITGPGTGAFDDNEFKIEITKNNTSGVAEIYIPLSADIPSGAAAGDIVAEILNLSGQLPSGSVVVGVVAKGAVTVSVSTPEFISTSGDVTFTIRENSAGALKEAGDSVKITLPKGFEWAGDGFDMSNLAGDVAWTAPKDATNDRVLYVDVSAKSNSKSIIRFKATINVDETAAKYGDVEVSIGGKSSVSPSKLVVAKYAEFGAKLSAKDATEFLAGRLDQEIGKLVIEETAPGSLVEGRTIILTLPTGVKWNTLSLANLDATNLSVTSVSINSDRDRATLRLGPATTTAGKLVIEEATVDTAVDFKGDLKVKVSGSAGLSGELAVATVKPPISVAADKPNVKIGVQGQAAGDLIITEAAAEALIKGKTLVIEPVLAGVSFDATPTATVTQGDVDVDLRKAAGSLTLTIEAESTVASTIKISGITYTVSRAFPEGNVELKISGNAVDEVNDSGTPLFDKNRTVAKVVNAVCVTPAPVELKQSAAFVIGSTTYTVNGVEATMDVAPYVKDGRTYLPVRFAGQALGVAEENIFWDNATRTATLIKGDRVVQFTIGQKAVVINGARVAIDVAPEITNKRTMLPFRHIATAFGASVLWDGATQTVTMEL